MFLSVVTYFGLISTIIVFKTRPNYVFFNYLVVALKTVGEPSSGRPEGGRGVAVFNSFGTLITGPSLAAK